MDIQRMNTSENSADRKALKPEGGGALLACVRCRCVLTVLCVVLFVCTFGVVIDNESMIKIVYMIAQYLDCLHLLEGFMREVY